ncbi:MAG: Na+/H+ antiporter subunit E [Hyphomicrobiaceae bacterium]
MRHVSLFAFLLLFWLALSGHFTPFLLAAGVGSALVCVVVAYVLGASDQEGHPVHLLGRGITYFPWIVIEICKSAWAVTKIVVAPRLDISPTMTRVEAGQRTAVGISVYANSITLTPGTITTGVRGNVLTVHALVRDGAIDLEGGGMDARVTQFEGRS